MPTPHAISKLEIDIVELTIAYRTLNLINHRNKNQHRRNGWWKSFSMLRRAVGKLVRQSERNLDNRMHSTIAFMKDHLFPQSYLSFTQLVADNQFSVLGLVLLAELARTQKAVGAQSLSAGDVFHQGEVVAAVAQRPVTGLSEDIGEVLARPHDSINPKLSAADAIADADILSDLPAVESGEQEVCSGGMKDPSLTLPRTPVGLTSDGHTECATLPEPTRESSKKRKKRRNSNPIDDLFEGLS